MPDLGAMFNSIKTNIFKIPADVPESGNGRWVAATQCCDDDEHTIHRFDGDSPMDFNPNYAPCRVCGGTHWRACYKCSGDLFNAVTTRDCS